MKKPFHGWRKFAAKTTAMSKIPIYKRTAKNPFRSSLRRIAMLVAAVATALAVFGSPALRISYRWNGNDYNPIYYECTYLSLLSGWERVRFGQYSDQCPIVAGIKITNLNFLTRPFQQTYKELFHD